MGLFKNMGRKFEEFKKASEEVAADSAEYECTECGKLLYTSHDECPDCGGEVVALETEAETATEETESSSQETTSKSATEK
ncbi:MAG TPA: hypothetical protein VE134_07705 [Methanomicrobiales archaeon]|nr:hypothetical protein [Methanomicrobiales archaeon]